MKKLFMMVFLCVSVLFVTSSYGYEVKTGSFNDVTSGYGDWYNSDTWGGEMQLISVNLPNYQQNAEFTTFCVEEGELVHPYTTYDATINDYIDHGYTTSPLKDEVSSLYHYYLNDNITVNSDNEGLELQLAMWHYLDQVNLDNPNDNQYISYINTHGVVDNNIKSLSLTYEGENRQDVMVITEPDPSPGEINPIPEPTTFLLLGTGLIFFAGFTRRIYG